MRLPERFSWADVPSDGSTIPGRKYDDYTTAGCHGSGNDASCQRDDQYQEFCYVYHYRSYKCQNVILLLKIRVIQHQHEITKYGLRKGPNLVHSRTIFPVQEAAYR